MQKDITHAKSMLINATNLQSTYTPLLRCGHSKHGVLMWLDLLLLVSQKVIGTSLPTIDYFSKWSAAITLKEVKTSDVVKFIKNYVIYRFGISQRIIHYNGPQFISQAFYNLCEKFNIKSVTSIAYNPSTNGLAKALKKTMIKIPKISVIVSRLTALPCAHLPMPCHFLW